MNWFAKLVLGRSWWREQLSQMWNDGHQAGLREANGRYHEGYQAGWIAAGLPLGRMVPQPVYDQTESGDLVKEEAEEAVFHDGSTAPLHTYTSSFPTHRD